METEHATNQSGDLILRYAAPELTDFLGERDLRWRIPYLRHLHVNSPAATESLNQFEALWKDSFSEVIGDHPALYLLEDAVLSAEWNLPDGELSMTISCDGIEFLLRGAHGIVEELDLERNEGVEAAAWVAKRVGEAIR